MSNRWLLFLVTLPVLLASLATMVGCQAYETFTFKEDEIHFSFEYPASYRVVNSGISEGVGDRVGFYIAVVELEAEGGAGIYIEFAVIQHFKNNPDAASWLENVLSSLSEQKDFKLLERSTVTVAGVDGEAIVYTASAPGYPASSAELPLLTWREVFFDYNSESWLISLRSSIKADKAIFEHILETFKILD